jgi:predicted exporter
MKNIALVLVVVLLGVLAWWLFQSHDTTVVVNGHEITGPAKFAVEGWGALVAIVSSICAAILLLFVFTGTGLMIFGGLVIAGVVAACVAFPYLLPVLIPLFLVWLFVALTQRRGKPDL